MNDSSDERTVELGVSTEVRPSTNRSGPPTWVRLCGQLGQLSVVSHERETAILVWQTERRHFSPKASPLLLTCKLAELYHQRRAVHLPEVTSALLIVWLEVRCDDTLSVVLRPASDGGQFQEL